MDYWFKKYYFLPIRRRRFDVGFKPKVTTIKKNEFDHY